MDTTKELYYRLLGLKDPWYVDRVDVDIDNNRVDVYVKHNNPIRVACPECGEFYAPYDHSPERVYQHLRTCQFQTFVHVQLPRVKCPKHGVKQIVSEFGEGKSSQTYAFERYIIELIQECSISATARLTGLSWDEVFGSMQRAVGRGFERKTVKIPEYLAVDEKSLTKGKKYETLVCDHKEGNVEYIVEDNSQKSLESYFKRFKPEEKATVKAITMDMWDPYIAATRNHIPNWESKLVFDRFHVMCHMTEAVDKVRKAENKELHAAGNDILKGSKYLWLYNRENIPSWRRPEFRQLQDSDLKVSRAWAIKENLRNFWDYHSETWARKFFRRWYFWASHSRLQPVKKAAKTIKTHFENVLTYTHHRITNAVVEGLNSKIEKVKRTAYGFRNRHHYRTAIYFHCGGLDLFPKRPDKPIIKWAFA